MSNQFIPTSTYWTPRMVKKVEINNIRLVCLFMRSESNVCHLEKKQSSKKVKTTSL